jgi:hypothetical protein
MRTGFVGYVAPELVEGACAVAAIGSPANSAHTAARFK